MKFTVDQIMAMTMEQLMEARRAVQEELRTDTETDYTAIVDAIEKREAALAARNELRSRVAKGLEGTNARPAVAKNEPKTYSVGSPEYRSGWLKMMSNQEDDMTQEERTAVSYVATTTDATYGAKNLIPTTLLNMIWDMIDEQHSILGDITLYRTGTILEIAKRTGITQGDAATVNENAANDDEINTYTTVKLTGKDFSKHVNISYAMAKMAISAFEPFLAREIADRLGAALAADVMTEITTNYDSTNNAVTTAEDDEIAYKDVAAAMATLENAMGQCVVYATRKTIYKQLVGMVDTTGRPIFQPNAQAGQEGTLIGCPVKVEDAVTDDVLVIGYPKNVVGNMIQDIMVESDKDIKKHVITYAGYARFEAKLIAPKSFATLTVSTTP